MSNGQGSVFNMLGAGTVVVVVVVVAPLPASTGGWAAERAPGYFPPGTLCGVCVDLDERSVPQEGNYCFCCGRWFVSLCLKLVG